MQYGPMLMNVAAGDTDAKLCRYAAFDDNMDVVLELVNKIHSRPVNIPEFELVRFKWFLLQFSMNNGKFKIMYRCVTLPITGNMQFLFPVYTGSHHYIICYNIKKPRWEIIDNLVQEMSFEDTYGDLPWKLVCQFLV